MSTQDNLIVYLQRWSFSIVLTLIFLLNVSIGIAESAEQTSQDSPDNIYATLAAKVTTNLQYCTGGGSPLYLDIAQPGSGTGPFPGLIFIHGGGWRSGDKSDFSSKIKEAAERGYVAVSVDYRLAPQWGFPAAVEDVKCVVRWMKANSAQYGINPHKIGAMGTSAGANLAAMLAVTDQSVGLEGTGGYTEYSSAVHSLVDWYGPASLVDMYYTTNLMGRTALNDYLGELSPATQPNYVKADPITYVTSNDPPTLIEHGDKDEVVPIQGSYLFRDLLTAAGVNVKMTVYPNAGHGLKTGDNLILTEHNLSQAWSETWSHFDKTLK